MTLELISPRSPTLHAVEEDEGPPGLAARVVTALIVGLPFLALVFGVIRVWGRGIHLRDVLLAATFYLLAGHGISVGFHRLLAHKSFTARRPAHLGWLFTARRTSWRRHAADLRAARDIVVMDALFPVWCIVSLALPFGLGRRPFATKDRSGNVAALAIISMGESWHNGHHAFPRSARHGLLPGQWDSSAMLISALERMALIHDVHGPTPEAVRNRSGQIPTRRVTNVATREGS